MKTKALLLLLVGILATTGSTCIQDGFLVSVNVPIKATFPITAGPNLAYNGTQTIKLSDLIDASYLDNLKNVRYFDVRISTTGSYNGTVYVNGSIDGSGLIQTKSTPTPWSDLATPQSLMTDTTKFNFLAPGLQQLFNKLTAFKSNPNTTVTLSANGTLSGQTPVPSGLALVVEIYAQADAEVK
jgi:hypothetical protein